ncbi:MAG TPA: TRAP transporter small permease, partial [Steroidobacteraceae bacterium]|nr:TRAP transporter small permease [Steroidobacteraceae bacterium]
MKSLLSSVASALGRLNRPLSMFGRNLAAALLAVMLALALAQIVSRGLFHYSLDWAEELARVALVWSVLLTAPYAYRHGAHVA